MVTNVGKLLSDLESLIEDTSLEEEINLAKRSKAYDLIAMVHQVVRVRGREGELELLEKAAATLEHRLRETDQVLFDRLRSQIRSKDFSHEALRHECDLYTSYSRGPERALHLGYDALDVLVAGLLRVRPPPEKIRSRHPEMAHLEPTPARAVLDLIDRMAFQEGDVFYDLGSGLGEVVIMVNLLTGVHAKGIEIEPTYCNYAQECAQELKLDRVTFLNADAREANYGDGTVFFMFTPFTGRILGQVLEKLCEQAERRTIRVCTYGPCTLDVAVQPWLRSIDSSADHEFELAIFESCAP